MESHHEDRKNVCVGVCLAVIFRLHKSIFCSQEVALSPSTEVEVHFEVSTATKKERKKRNREREKVSIQNCKVTEKG